MSHQLQEISCRKSTWSATDDGDALPCRLCLWRYRNGIQICKIYGRPFESANIDRRIQHVSTASLLARMLTDQCTRHRKRIILSDQTHSILISARSGKSDIARNVYMCRALVDTWDRLFKTTAASVMLYMRNVVLLQAVQAHKHHTCRLKSDCTVC